jgi:DNA-binding NarL/FixJ family response regulator
MTAGPRPHTNNASPITPGPEGAPDPGRRASGRALRLVVVDQHALLHSVYEEVLSREGFVIAAFGRSGSELIPLVHRHAPEAVVLELDLPELDGITAIRRLTHHFPAIPAIVLTASASGKDAAEAFEAGAKGYILKTVELDDLGDILHRVLGGGVDGVVGHPRTESRPADGLTTRELEVLHLLAKGYSNGKIAARLGRTERTAKFHLGSIYRKLDVKTRTGAVSAALAAGIMDEHS